MNVRMPNSFSLVRRPHLPPLSLFLPLYIYVYFHRTLPNLSPSTATQVMPLIPDLKFQVNWTSSASAESLTKIDEETFRQARRCQDSDFLQERYKICGRRGAMKDRPLKVSSLVNNKQIGEPQ